MNKSQTLHEMLRRTFEAEGLPRDTREMLADGLRAKSAGRFRPLAILSSMRLDLGLFVHRYFAGVVASALLLAGAGAWIALAALQPTIPTITKINHAVAVAPAQQYSIAAIRWNVVYDRRQPSSGNRSQSTSHVRVSSAEPVLQEERQITTIAPRMPLLAVPNEGSTHLGILTERFRFSDAPADYSAVVFFIAYEQSTIPGDPAHPEFTARNTNDLIAQVGYRFDRFNEVGFGYARQIFRRLSSTTTIWQTYNPATGLTTFTPQTTWNASDDPISLPGLYYTFHGNNLQFFGIEPFLSGFASKPSAGFLWRASAGMEWNAWNNLNAVISYSREQLNSGAYAAPQNSHSFFSFGLSYRLLP